MLLTVCIITKLLLIYEFNTIFIFIIRMVFPSLCTIARDTNALAICVVEQLTFQL